MGWRDDLILLRPSDHDTPVSVKWWPCRGWVLVNRRKHGRREAPRLHEYSHRCALKGRERVLGLDNDQVLLRRRGGRQWDLKERR